MKRVCTFILLALMAPAAMDAEFHISPKGDDANPGSANKPFKTITAAAQAAQPGDIVTVHEGIYREWVKPPRGGESDAQRIVYQAAPGEKVEIRGSEAVTGWERVQNDTWKVVVANTLFGGYNPYSDLIHGDWFEPGGREHHTGAVYLNGDWLIEAATLDEVLAPTGTVPLWYGQTPGALLNVAWLRPIGGLAEFPKTAGTSFVENHGTQNAPCEEGGDCIGYIVVGNWVKYRAVDFGEDATAVEIRAASASDGGIIEVRLNAPDGELLGTCRVPNTGGWQSWSSFKANVKPQSGVKTVCLGFKGITPTPDTAPPCGLPRWMIKPRPSGPNSQGSTPMNISSRSTSEGRSSTRKQPG